MLAPAAASRLKSGLFVVRTVWRLVTTGQKTKASSSDAPRLALASRKALESVIYPCVTKEQKRQQRKR
jgi:hypothetical protein